jgi:hypothetical protein
VAATAELPPLILNTTRKEYVQARLENGHQGTSTIPWVRSFIRDPSGPFMDTIAVRPESASTLFRGERETNLARGGLQKPIRATSIEALLNLPFRGIGAEEEMIRHVPSQQG